jgi:hypothetical protein
MGKEKKVGKSENSLAPEFEKEQSKLRKSWFMPISLHCSPLTRAGVPGC